MAAQGTENLNLLRRGWKQWSNCCKSVLHWGCHAAILRKSRQHHKFLGQNATRSAWLDSLILVATWLGIHLHALSESSARHGGAASISASNVSKS
jgi:hypothetical protein